MPATARKSLHRASDRLEQAARERCVFRFRCRLADRGASWVLDTRFHARDVASSQEASVSISVARLTRQCVLGATEQHADRSGLAALVSGQSSAWIRGETTVISRTALCVRRDTI